MKLKSKLKMLAASVAIGFAASAGAASIDAGITSGNGNLFFNMWDETGSYTLNLGLTIDSFASGVAAAGLFSQNWTADAALNSFISAHSGAEWNLTAGDGSGARRLLSTYEEGSMPVTGSSAGNVRAAILNTGTWLINNVNPELASADSATFLSTDPGYAGFTGIQGPGNAGYNLLNFLNSGTTANNSYDNGLGFLIVNANATGSAASTYAAYLDEGSSIRAYLDGSNTLYLEAVAAVPEPETYGMLAAGLLMLGAVARRRRQA